MQRTACRPCARRDDIQVHEPAPLALLHPPESHACGARHARGDIARGKAGLALGHLFMWAAQTIPPRSALGRARQRATDNRLDLLEAQDELAELLRGEVVPQG